MEIVTQRSTQSGSFFAKSGHFLSKRVGEAPSLFPNCVPLSMAEYGLISPSISKYP